MRLGARGAAFEGESGMMIEYSLGCKTTWILRVFEIVQWTISQDNQSLFWQDSSDCKLN